jgi:hypothetical protein
MLLLHTGQLPAPLLRSTRRLLELAFDEFDDADWSNTLGGMHALTFDGGVYVFPGPTPLDLDGELTADWRAGDVW